MHHEPQAGQDPYIKDNYALIASDKVEGTSVYGADGKRIGSIQRILLEKRGGKVAYAVLSFGGFLGIGDDYYPLPWEKLTYDEQLDGYRIDLTKGTDHRRAALREPRRRQLVPRKGSDDLRLLRRAAVLDVSRPSWASLGEG